MTSSHTLVKTIIEMKQTFINYAVDRMGLPRVKVMGKTQALEDIERELSAIKDHDPGFKAKLLKLKEELASAGEHVLCDTDEHQVPLDRSTLAKIKSIAIQKMIILEEPYRKKLFPPTEDNIVEWLYSYGKLYAPTALDYLGLLNIDDSKVNYATYHRMRDLHQRYDTIKKYINLEKKMTDPKNNPPSLDDSKPISQHHLTEKEKSLLRKAVNRAPSVILIAFVAEYDKLASGLIREEFDLSLYVDEKPKFLTLKAAAILIEEVEKMRYNRLSSVLPTAADLDYTALKKIITQHGTAAEKLLFDEIVLYTYEYAEVGCTMMDDLFVSVWLKNQYENGGINEA